MSNNNVRVSGPAAVVLFLVNIAIGAWFIYLLIKVAQHVEAWPF